MFVDEQEKRRLLAEVKRTSEESRAASEAAERAAAERAAAVQAAMDSGVPRQEIADAAGMHRNNIYRLIGKTSR
ncbi:hypothetical protein G7Y41_06945 [Schaalia sp. ZJ405]|uniref:hypothetical protein n=1 Tax=Schaalia sp. ZJ405 TaxID=2709403 RepID=UPI0013EB3E76|nr:hypothetical protein [Schaalia sp. ZJ405]QPK82302.1 hypothetical protein G7Y41_06945 [Schaalia sp. ZJ405]